MGRNNVYFKMNKITMNNLIDISCPALILHNAEQAAYDCFSIDIQLIINKIYQLFHIYSVRVEELKSFCEFTINLLTKTIREFYEVAKRGGFPFYLQHAELLTFFSH